MHSTSSMSLEAHATKALDYSMAFYMKLAFVKMIGHKAQVYKDPMNRWVVKVEYYLTTFEAAPWVN